MNGEPPDHLEALEAMLQDSASRAGRKLFRTGSTRERLLLATVDLKVASRLLGKKAAAKRFMSKLVGKPVAPLETDPEHPWMSPEDLKAIFKELDLALLIQKQYESMVRVSKGSFANPEVNYEPPSDRPTTDALAKLIAFYLPQYHRIEENDRWWGPGFTEWTNVSKAVPHFYGHYQPHLPGELNYYDLRVDQVLERQVELAQQYGVHGFAFYHYWFAGRRLLEKPLEAFLNNPKIKMPFCLMWANENWTRRWDGLEDDILMQQVHNAETDAQYIEHLRPYLEDERYIRFQGRPLIMVYRAELMPDPAATVGRFREYCGKHSLGNPMVVAAQAFEFHDPEVYGFDAAVQFPPLHTHPDTHLHGSGVEALRSLHSGFTGSVYSYPSVVKHKEAEPEPSGPLIFETAFPCWDNTARKPGNGFTFAFASPELYKRWLSHITKRALANPQNPDNFVFVNAWNEWAEGAHLEPDRRHGYGYLLATREVLESGGVALPDSSAAAHPSPPAGGAVIDLGGFVRAVDGAVGVSFAPASSFSVVLREPVARRIEAFVSCAALLIPRFEARFAAHDIVSEELHQWLYHLLPLVDEQELFDQLVNPVAGADFPTKRHEDGAKRGVRATFAEDRVYRLLAETRFHANWVDAIYAGAYARQFYSTEELAVFREYWCNL